MTSPAVSGSCADATGAAATRTPVSLYVHVPFCVSKCAYCDFHSEAGEVDAPAPEPASLLAGWLTPGERLAGTTGEAFLDAVLGTLEQWRLPKILGDAPTLYFGGGTPTVLGPLLVDLVAGIRERVGLRPAAEITVETNPETTTPELVEALMTEGVNRFSLGVQSLDDAVLRTLGRCHDAERALLAAATLRNAGVTFSVDLMCGVPGQSFESWDSTLESAVACGARHLSVYPLTIEPGTPMADAVSEGRIPTPDPDVAADMMIAADVALSAAGMPRYEVANYAQPGHESRHNLTYWTGGAYLGIGPSAASMLPLDAYRATGLGLLSEPPGRGVAGGRVRFRIPPDTAGFIRHGLDTVDPEAEYLSAEQAAREDVMLGLRLTAGVTAAEVDSAGLTEVLVGLDERGLVRLDDRGAGPRWRTTEQGWLLGNEVFGAVWAGE